MTMGMMKQKQRKARDKKTQDTDMNPKERAQLEAYIFPHPNSRMPLPYLIRAREDGEQEGIPCVVHVIIGLAQDINRVCVAAWEDVPGSQLTKEV